MFTIYLPLNMDLDHAEEAKRSLVHAIERINQKRGTLGSTQKEKLEFLTRQFNEGHISALKLEDSLKNVIREALNMAKTN